MTGDDSRSIGADEFGAFVDGLDYPVYVVTTAYDGQRSGCLVGFTTQVSIDPPRMLVCISHNNHTHTVVERAELLAVHVLSPEQRSLAELFGATSGDDTDKFAQCSWRPGPGDVPILDGCPRHMVGRIVRRIPFPDHLGLLLEPVEVVVSQAPVALSLQDALPMEPGHPA